MALSKLLSFVQRGELKVLGDWYAVCLLSFVLSRPGYLKSKMIF